ncbi:MAG TPA: hypothetical protein V6D00_13225 [Pantanalinema sp.]
MRPRHTIAVALAATILMLGASAGYADVPDDKSGRVREYKERHFELTTPSSHSYEIRQGEGTASVRVGDRALVERTDDQELSERLVGAERTRAAWQLAWGVAIPLGLFVFYDNFLGKPRPTGEGLSQLPAPVVSFYPGNDLRSYAIAALGAVAAGYGAGNVGSWAAERFGWAFPNLLSQDDAKRGVKRANDRLLDELALVPADLLAASTSVATAETTESASASATLRGETGSAAHYLEKAASTLHNQRGEGYRLYLVYTKDLADKSGKLQNGSWRYLFYNSQKLEAMEVAVPIFGASPTVGPAPDAFKEWRTGTNLADTWKVDSPKAMTDLQNALVERGVPWLTEDTTMILYPRYGNFQTPIWLLDQGQGPLSLGVGIDAASGLVVDLKQAGLGLGAGMNPGGGK